MRHETALAGMTMAAWLGACAPVAAPDAVSPSPPVAVAPSIERAAYAGARQRFDFLTTLRPDCSYLGPSNYRFLVRPQHGLVDFKPTHEPPAYVQSSIFYKCNDQHVPGVILYYTPDRFYAGSDHFVMEWISPAGLLYRRAYEVTIR